MSPPPLKILRITDGRAGHHRIGDGIVAALSRRQATRVSTLSVRRPRWLPPRYLSRLINAKVSPRFLLRRIYKIDPDQIPKCDVIVSAGGDTMAANIAIKRLHDIPHNLFYGSLRRYKAEDFSLILSSNIAAAGLARHVFTLKPSRIKTASSPKIDAAARPVSAHKIGLVFGGNTRTIQHSMRDVEQILDFVKDMYRTHGTSWVIANAPRTPNRISDRLAQFAQIFPDDVVSFIDFRVTGLGSIEPMFAQTQVIISTADSSNVISEAVWTKTPCISVMAQKGRVEEKETGYRQWLKANNWIRELRVSDLTKTTYQTALDEIQPLNYDPFEKLADELQRALPELVGH